MTLEKPKEPGVSRRVLLQAGVAGLGDYWDDADRWIRNQFAEGQLTSGQKTSKSRRKRL